MVYLSNNLALCHKLDNKAEEACLKQLSAEQKKGIWTAVKNIAILVVKFICFLHKEENKSAI